MTNSQTFLPPSHSCYHVRTVPAECLVDCWLSGFGEASWLHLQSSPRSTLGVPQKNSISTNALKASNHAKLHVQLQWPKVTPNKKIRVAAVLKLGPYKKVWYIKAGHTYELVKCVGPMIGKVLTVVFGTGHHVVLQDTRIQKNLLLTKCSVRGHQANAKERECFLGSPDENRSLSRPRRWGKNNTDMNLIFVWPCIINYVK